MAVLSKISIILLSPAQITSSIPIMFMREFLIASFGFFVLLLFKGKALSFIAGRMFFGAVFIVVLAYYMSEFIVFLRNEIGIFGVGVVYYIVMALAIFYSMRSGIEAIARTSFIILAVFLLSFIFTAVFNYKNYTFEMVSPENNFWIDNLGYIFFSLIDYAAFGAMIYKTDKYHVRYKAAFSLISLLVSILIFSFITACLGAYVTHTEYPYYIFASSAQVSIFKHFAPLQYMLITMTAFTRMSYLAICSSLCMRYKGSAYKDIALISIAAISAVLIDMFNIRSYDAMQTIVPYSIIFGAVLIFIVVERLIASKGNGKI